MNTNFKATKNELDLIFKARSLYQDKTMGANKLQNILDAISNPNSSHKTMMIDAIVKYCKTNRLFKEHMIKLRLHSEKTKNVYNEIINRLANHKNINKIDSKVLEGEYIPRGR